MTEPVLPSLGKIRTDGANAESPLAFALSTLFEPSPILLNALVPQVALRLESADPLNDYTELLHHAFEVINTWSDDERAQFVHGHPRIGEVKGLSKLSAQEQGGASGNGLTNEVAPTPPEVLSRLAFLNKCYERRYPSLVYVTFVNGRSRADIRDEMEKKLGAEGIVPENEQSIENIEPHDTAGDTWRKELDRAVEDVGRIAKSRLAKMTPKEF